MINRISFSFFYFYRSSYLEKRAVLDWMLEKQNEGFNRLVVCLIIIRLDYLIIIQFKIRALLLKY